MILFLSKIINEEILFFWFQFPFYQEATMKDALEREKEPNLDLKAYLRDAYAHPAFKKREDDDKVAGDEAELETIWCPPSTSHARGHQSPASSAAHHHRPYLMLSKNSDSTP